MRQRRIWPRILPKMGKMPDMRASGAAAQEFDLRMDALADYRICVQGCLDESWSERMAGLDVQSTSETTTLTGSLPDQAALSGVLNTLYDLQLPVVSVELLQPDRDK